MVAQQLLNILFEFVVVCATASSFYFYFRPTGVFHLTHGSTILIAAYAVIWFEGHGIPLWLAGAAALGVGTVCGYCFVALYRLVPQSPTRNVSILVASIGVALIVQNVCAILFGDQVRRASGAVLDTVTPIPGGVSLSSAQAFDLLLGLASIAAMLCIWYGTLLGRSARAISEDAKLAYLLGVPVERRLAELTLISAAGASVVGIIVALDTGVGPTSGLDYLLPGIVAAVIGGGAGLRGVLLGALVLSVATSSCAYYIGSNWADLMSFLILAGFLVARPSGAEPLSRRADAE
jgi:branched-chain amino acid transport system permease protein